MLKTLSIANGSLLVGLMIVSAQAFAGTPVQFDLPSTAAATRIEGPESLNESGSSPGQNLVTVNLQLSSLIDVAHPLKVDQWIVRCRPRDQRLQLADYAPRTETASQLSSPIQVKSTNESNDAFGASLDGGYGRLASGHVGVDSIDKQIETLQYDRLAPHQVVVASGTTDRGRGVYFKLRSTEQQVLEGEKEFSLTWKVPRSWRSCLLDVSVEAQVETRSLTNLWDRETKTISSHRFLVAVYLAEDQDAKRAAEQLADAERSLRVWNLKIEGSRNSFTSVLRSVSRGFGAADPSRAWLQRLLDEQADPHLDKQIRELPMNVRVAVLDYVERREAFRDLNHVHVERRLVGNRGELGGTISTAIEDACVPKDQ